MTIKTKEAFQVIDFGLLAIRETTQGIRKSLGRELIRNKKAEAVKRKTMRRLLDRKKKAEIEKLQENKKPNLASKSVSNLAKSGGNFITRVIKAFGSLVLGYMMMNLPKLLEKIKKIIDTSVAIGKFIGDFVKDIINIGASIVDLVKEFVVQIKEFDFDADKIKEKFDAIGTNIDSLQDNWDKNSRNLRDQIKKFEKDGEKAIAGTLSGERTGALLKLQEQRDSGELSEDEYQKEVLKLYEVEPTKEIEVEEVSSSLDKNFKSSKDGMGPAEFFGTNQYSDSTTDDITTDDSSGSSEGGTVKKEVIVEGNGEVDLSTKSKEQVPFKTKNIFAAKTLNQYVGPEYTPEKLQEMKDQNRNERKIAFYEKKLVKYFQLKYPGTSGTPVMIGEKTYNPGDEGYVEAYTKSVEQHDKEFLASHGYGLESNSQTYNVFDPKNKSKINVPMNFSASNSMLGGQHMIPPLNNSGSIFVYKEDNSLKRLETLRRAFT